MREKKGNEKIKTDILHNTVITEQSVEGGFLCTLE